MQADNQILLILTLVVVLVLALSINYYFYKRQEALEQKRIRSKQLKGKIENLLNVLVTLKTTPCDAGLMGVLNDYANHLLQQLNQLSPNPSLAEQLERTRSSTPDSNFTFHNPGFAKQVQKLIGHAQPFLKELKVKGRITPILFDKYNREIQWLYTAVEIDAHLDQARSKAEEGNKSAAILHCNHARTIIARTILKDPRKDEKMAETRNLIEEWRPKPAPEQNTGEDVGAAAKPVKPQAPARNLP